MLEHVCVVNCYCKLEKKKRKEKKRKITEKKTRVKHAIKSKTDVDSLSVDI